MKARSLGYIFSMLICVLILAACASDTGSTEDQNGDTDVAQAEDEMSEAQVGGELNYAFHQQPPSLDPHTTTDTTTRDLSLHIFEALLTMNSNLEVAPMLAESFEVTDDGQTITFHLREGVMFHNGDEMTSEDVVASLERWHQLSSQAQTYHTDTTFEAVDDYTVVAHVPDPTTMDLYVLADMTQFAAVMPKEIVEGVGAETVSEYVGTGPYQFEEFRQDQYVHLTRFDDYQSRSEPSDALAGEKHAYVDDIYFHFVTDPSTRVAGLQSGEYDIANAIPQDAAEQLEGQSEIVLDIAFTSFPIVVFNKKAGVFTDQKVRQAVNAAVNVDDMLIAAYNNDDYYVKDHALVGEEQTAWYSDEGRDVYELYDPELAEKLLAESTYDGEEVVILTSREYIDEYNMTIVIEEALKNIGMNVRLEESDLGTILERREDEQVWDIIMSRFAIRPVPTQYLFLNPEWYGWTDSEELSTLSDHILHASKPEEAQAYSDDYHRAFWEYLPIMKPGNKTSITAMRNHVEGFDFLTGPIVWNVQLAE